MYATTYTKLAIRRAHQKTKGNTSDFVQFISVSDKVTFVLISVMAVSKPLFKSVNTVRQLLPLSSLKIVRREWKVCFSAI